MSTRRAFITGAVAGAAAVAIGGPEVEKRFFGGNDLSKPKETKLTPEPIKVIPESDATIEELPLILPSSLASVLGYSGYDELWDNKGRIKSLNGDRWYKVFTAKGANVGPTNERRILSDFPRAITKLRLSPDGESFLINTSRGEGSGRFSFYDGSSMFDPFPPSTMVLFRPTQLGEKQKVINLPVGAPATYDGIGRVFVYTTGKVTDLGRVPIDSESGIGSPIDPPKDLLYPEIRIYDLKKLGTPEIPIGQPSLNYAANETNPLNKRWARFLSNGKADTLEAVYLRNSAENNNFAVTPDGQWACVPVDENFYWTEGDRPYVANSKGLIISRLFVGKLSGQEEKTIFQDLNSLIRVSPLEYHDLNGQARTVEVVGVTEQGQFLVAFYQKPVKGFDVREAVFGMVNPQAGGSYEIRYVSLPRMVLEINRRMAGVFPNFRPDIDEYLNTPYISNEKLKELAGLPAWRRYKLENGNWELDRAFPIHQDQEKYLNVPKPTPTPVPAQPPRLPGTEDL